MFGYTPKIGGYILTRDSLWWFWGRVVGLSTLVVTAAADPTFNLIDLTWLMSPLNMHKMQAAAAVVVYISAQLSRSNLPSKADAQKVSLPVKEQV